MQVAIGILAGLLALLCVASLVYIYRQQNKAAAAVLKDENAVPAQRLDS